jgi:hypothetical protein
MQEARKSFSSSAPGGRRRGACAHTPGAGSPTGRAEHAAGQQHGAQELAPQGLALRPRRAAAAWPCRLAWRGCSCLGAVIAHGSQKTSSFALLEARRVVAQHQVGRGEGRQALEEIQQLHCRRGLEEARRRASPSRCGRRRQTARRACRRHCRRRGRSPGSRPSNCRATSFSPEVAAGLHHVVRLPSKTLSVATLPPSSLVNRCRCRCRRCGCCGSDLRCRAGRATGRNRTPTRSR